MNLIARKTSLASDLFFCLIFMPAIIVLGPVKYWIQSWPLFASVTVAFFYATYAVMRLCDIPKLMIARRYRRIALVTAALVVCNYLLTCYPHPQVEFVTTVMSEYQTRVRNYGITLSLWLIFSLVAGYALTTSFVRELYEQLLLTRKIESQRDKAKLAVFRAQISPHFMFNTLNTLYSLVIGTSQKAEDAFIKFADMLKYTYVTVESETVAIGDEIAYIKNYIDLQALRLNSHTTIGCEWSVDNGREQIPPMILLTFVENAFKYGTSACRDCTVSIVLSLENRHLKFDVRNMIMRHADEFGSDVPVGIENSRARLAALYPGRHSLTTSDENGVFHVSLTIDL